MKKIILLFFIFSKIALANEQNIWNAHPERGHSLSKRMKLILSSIRDQKIAFLGQSFMALEEEFQETVFYNFKSSHEIQNEILTFDKKAFDDLENFKKRFKIFSYYRADKNRYYKKSNESLIQEIFLIKEMIESIHGYYNNIEESLNDSIDRETSQFDKLVEKIASGDLSIIGANGFKVPPSLLNVVGMGLTGKSVKDALKKDILEIVSPGKDPTSSTDSRYNLEGTSIYLTKKLFEDDKKLLNVLIEINKIKSIPYHYNLYDFFKRNFSLTSLNTIRIINLANHNHGLEYFLINGLIDINENPMLAVKEIFDAMSGLNNLYKIINLHEEERKSFSALPQDQLNRKYHYWAGALVTCELIDRNYNSMLAKFISSKLGELYETFGDKTADQESQNDILLHSLGATFAAKTCN